MRRASGPAPTAKNGTRSGPGATPRPVRSADQPQTSWHQRVTISSIAPNAAPNTTFAAVAVENAGSLSRCGSMTGAGCRADRRTNSSEQDRGHRDRAQYPGRCPAPLVGLDQGKGERADRDREQRGAHGVRADSVGCVGAGALLAVISARQHAQAGQQRDGRDRDVHQEDPAPVRGDQRTAEHRAQRGRRSPDRGPAADSAGALVRRRRRQQQAEGRRHEQRAAGRLDDPRDDEQPDIRCHRTRGGGERENDDAGQERGAPADQVGGPPRRDEQRREHDRVGVQHPGQR